MVESCNILFVDYILNSKEMGMLSFLDSWLITECPENYSAGRSLKENSPLDYFNRVH